MRRTAAVRIGTIRAQYPTFDAGTTHQFHLLIENPTPWSWTYEVWIFSQGFTVPNQQRIVTVPGNQSSTWNQSITIVNTPENYNVFIACLEQTTMTNLIDATVIDTITVISPAVPDISADTITWD